MTILPSVMIGDMLDVLIHDLVDGTAVVIPSTLFNHVRVKAWNGLDEVLIRYDCVTFVSDKDRVEVRVSMLPSKQADQIHEIWLLVSPPGGSYISLRDVWRRVMGGKPVYTGEVAPHE